MQFCTNDSHARLSSVGHKWKVTSLSHLQSSVWTDYIGDINHAAYFVSPSTTPAFLNNRSEKRKFTAPTANPVKNC